MSNIFNGPKINIEPKEDIITRELYSIIISVESIQLFTSAQIAVSYFDTNGLFIKVDRITMAGEDYANWSNDDQYIYTYVYNKLNITPLPNTI
jgi:hypothetical protein